MPEDTRVRMTKQLLNNAFIEILEQKQLTKVTVKEICAKAQINRSTYYVYYDNPYDQFEKLKLIFLDNLKKVLEQYKNDIISDDVERVSNALKVYYDNRKLFLVIANSSTFDELMNLFKSYTKTDILNFWSTEFDTNDLKKEYAFEYSTAGTLRIIYNWLSDKNGIKDINEILPLIFELFSIIENFL